MIPGIDPPIISGEVYYSLVVYVRVFDNFSRHVKSTAGLFLTLLTVFEAGSIVLL